MLYENLDWEKVREKVWKQNYGSLTLEEVLYIGKDSVEYTEAQALLACTQAGLYLDKVKGKQLKDFSQLALRRLLATDALRYNSYIIHTQRSMDKFRDVAPGTNVKLTAEARAEYRHHGFNIKDVVIENLYKRDDSHASYNVKGFPFTIKSYEIACIL